MYDAPGVNHALGAVAISSGEFARWVAEWKIELEPMPDDDGRVRAYVVRPRTDVQRVVFRFRWP